jgi:hypothetical protein
MSESEKFATNLFDLMNKSGFFEKLSSQITEQVSKALPSGANITIDKKMVGDAFTEAAKTIQFTPTVKVVHHGLKELQQCKQCAPELSAYVEAEKRKLIPEIKARLRK